MTSIENLQKKLTKIRDVPSLCAIYKKCKTQKQKEKFWNDLLEISLHKKIAKSLLKIKLQPFDESFHNNRAKPLLRFKNKPQDCSIIILSECVVVIHQENLLVIQFSTKKSKDTHYLVEELKYVAEWNWCWNAYDTICLTGYDLDFKLKHKHVNVKSEEQRIVNMEYCHHLNSNNNSSSSSSVAKQNSGGKCFRLLSPEFILMKKVATKQGSCHEIYYQTKWPFSIDVLEYLAWPKDEEQVRMVDLKLLLERPTVLVHHQCKRKLTTNILHPQKRQK